MFHGFDWSKWTTGPPGAVGASALSEEVLCIRDDVGFFPAVRAQLMKRSPGDARPAEELDHAVRQIICRPVASEGVMDIFAAAGLNTPDFSGLSDEFLPEAAQGRDRRTAAQERGAGPSPRCWIRPYGTVRTGR